MTSKIYRLGNLELCVSAYYLEPTDLTIRGRPVYKLKDDLSIAITGPGYRERIVIPAGFQTDLASIPVILAPIVGMPASAGVAAIAHDFACVNDWPRWHCNALLRSIMEFTGKPGWRCKAFWWAVFVFGYQSRITTIFSGLTRRRAARAQNA